MLLAVCTSVAVCVRERGVLCECERAVLAMIARRCCEHWHRRGCGCGWGWVWVGVSVDVDVGVGVGVV